MQRKEYKESQKKRVLPLDEEFDDFAFVLIILKKWKKLT